MRHTKWVPTLGLILVLLHSSASAGSVLNFPRLSFEAGSVTGIAIVNATEQNATVFLTAYDDSGNLVNGNGFTNPALRQVPAGSQFARVTQDIFGGDVDPSTIAWIEATSSVTGLTGFFLFLNGTISEFDGADLATPTPDISFNDIRIGGENSTEINLINPLTEPATISLQFSGMPETERTILLNPRGASRFDLAGFFDLTEVQTQTVVTGDRFLEVSGSGPISGFQLVRVGNGDTFGLNATPRNLPLDRIFFPQLAVLPPLETALTLSNFGDLDVLVTIRAYRPDGTLFGPPSVVNNPVTRTIHGHSRLEEDLEELFGFSGAVTQEGWILVEASQPTINGSVSYAIPGLASRAAVAGLGQGTNRALFSHLATTGDFFTGLAILNAGSLAANVRVVALSPSGQVLGTFTTLLQPGERISRLVHEIIPAAAGQGGGFLWVGSDIPVFLTSLFGNLVSRVLANIPPQPAPPGYRPDIGIPQLRIMPPLAVLQPMAQQDFASSGGSVQGWSVDAVAGGNAVVGTVNSSGRYTAPMAAPAELPVTVSAATQQQSAGAAVDILTSVEAVSGLGQLQSVVFLEGLKKLYTAEFTAGGAAASVRPATPPNSSIFDVSSGSPQLLLALGAEEIPDMEAYVGVDGREYLLLAARSSGRVQRLDPESKALVTVADGLNQPHALAFDGVTGTLLVASEDGLITLDASALDAGLIPAFAVQPAPREYVVLVPNITPSSLAVDGCSGDIYFTETEGGLLTRLRRSTGQRETVVSNLARPTRLQPLYRSDVSCPEALHLLVYEESAGRISIVLPAQNVVGPWVEAPGGIDLTFIPDTGVPVPNMGTQSALVSAEIPGMTGRLAAVLLPDLYRALPLNPASLSNCFGRVFFPDAELDAAVRAAVNSLLPQPIGPTAPLPCNALDMLENLDANRRNISSLEGLGQASNLTRLSLFLNSVSDAGGLEGLNRLVRLNLFANDLDPQTLPELPALRSLDVTDNGLIDLAPFSRFSELQTLDCGLNRINSLAPLVEMSQLRSLGASGNQIADLSPLSDLPGLVEITITDNLVTTLGPLSGLNDLEVLNAGENRISSLQPLVDLTRLKTLTVGGNPINDLSPIAGLTDLEVLGIDNLGLSNLDLIKDLDQLETLWIFQNPNLNSLAGLGDKANLRSLFARFCSINNIQDLAGLQQLSVIDLRNNQIVDLSPLVANPGLGNGDFLFLSGNPLSVTACAAINQLTMRGVNVSHDVACGP